MKTFPTLTVLVFLFMVSPLLLLAQIRDSSNNSIDDEINTDLVEDYIASGEGEEDFDFNALYEELEHFRSHPLNLNKVTREELESL